jgi:hypothetical protein
MWLYFGLNGNFTTKLITSIVDGGIIVALNKLSPFVWIILHLRVAARVICIVFILVFCAHDEKTFKSQSLRFALVYNRLW